MECGGTLFEYLEVRALMCDSVFIGRTTLPQTALNSFPVAMSSLALPHSGHWGLPRSCRNLFALSLRLAYLRPHRM